MSVGIFAEITSHLISFLGPLPGNFLTSSLIFSAIYLTKYLDGHTGIKLYACNMHTRIN